MNNLDFNGLVIKAANLITYEVSVKDIAAVLVENGCSIEQAFLIYTAAKVYLNGQT